jgi:hypothetical protein
MLTDFDPDAAVIVPIGGELRRVTLKILLPLPYQR